MEKIENKMLPIPLKYTYPIISIIKIQGKKTHNILYYVPELNRLVYKSNILKTLRKLGINRYVWELRWIYKVDGEVFTDKNLLVDAIIKYIFSSRLENTKKYIKSKLLEDINYVPDFYCLRSDIIDLFFKRELSTVYMSWYNFSKVPVFIKTSQTKFTIIVKEKDFSTGKDIENWNTDFNHFICSDSPRVGKHKSDILVMLENNKKFKENAIAKFGSTVDYSMVKYKGSDSLVKLRCKVCGNIYYQTPSDHLKSSINTHGCSGCYKNYYHDIFSSTFDDFVSKSRKIHGDRYTYYREEYIDYYTLTKIYDNERKEFFCQTPKNHANGHGNNLRWSMGEGLIKTWLINNNINFEKSVIIKDLIHGRNIDRVEIDFIVKLCNSTIWIEYNGIQHYKETEFFCHENMTFEKQLQRDENVRDYCKNNHIQLIEIPYTYKDYESVKDLLDRVILNGEDINSIIDYNSLYNN